MMNLNDVENIEGNAKSERAYYKSLQGSYGRAMMDAINAGACVLGREAARDYWGNRIPSRTEVKEGTKGSLSFVRERFGVNHARAMARVK